MKFILFTWDGGGVIPPQMAVARKLIAAGHEVRVVADPTVAEEAREAGCSFRPWQKAPHRTSRHRDHDLLRDYAYKNPLKYLNTDLQAYMTRPGPAWTEDCVAAIDAYRPDAVLLDLFVPWAAVAAEVRGLPSVAVSTMVYGIPTPGVPPLGFGQAPATTALGRLRETAFRKLSEWIYDKSLPVLNEVRRGHGLAPLVHTLDQIRRCDAIVVLTASAFDNRSAAIPSNVHWVGAMVDDPSWAQAWSSPWPEDDDRPLVLVALSSTYQAQIPLLQAAVDAIASMPVRGLVTLGPAVAPDEVRSPSKDVALVSSAPHGQVLPHASVVLTHCGHGTTIKALAAGVPMVCAPMGRDQMENAGRVARHGAGVVISKTANAATIRDALDRVLSEPSYGAAARAIGQRIAAREADEDVVSVCTSVAAARPAAA